MDQNHQCKAWRIILIDAIGIGLSNNRVKIKHFFSSKKKEKNLIFWYLTSAVKKITDFLLLFAMTTINAQVYFIYLLKKTLMPTDCHLLCWFAGSSVIYAKYGLPKCTGLINGSMAIGQTRFLCSMIDTIEKKIKNL